MTRQLLAFLALLTGLAAVNAPAHAADADTVACEIGVCLDDAQTALAEIVPVQLPHSTAMKGLQSCPMSAFADLPISSTATVLIRIDRASE